MLLLNLTGTFKTLRGISTERTLKENTFCLNFLSNLVPRSHSVEICLSIGHGRSRFKISWSQDPRIVILTLVSGINRPGSKVFVVVSSET